MYIFQYDISSNLVLESPSSIIPLRSISQYLYKIVHIALILTSRLNSFSPLYELILLNHTLSCGFCSSTHQSSGVITATDLDPHTAGHESSSSPSWLPLQIIYSLLLGLCRLGCCFASNSQSRQPHDYTKLRQRIPLHCLCSFLFNKPLIKE